MVMNEIDEYGEYSMNHKVNMNTIYEEMEIRNNEKEHRRSIYKDVMNQYYENFFCYTCGKSSLWMMRSKLYNCSSMCDHQYRDGGGHFGYYGLPREDPVPYGSEDDEDEDDNIYNPDPYRKIFDEVDFLNKTGKYIKNPTTKSDYMSNHRYNLKYVFEEMEVTQFEKRQWRYAYDAVMNVLKNN